VEHEPAVLPDAVVTGELAVARIALIHVDVVDPLVRLEAEDLVLQGFRPPALPERVERGRLVGQRSLHVVVDLLVQVVVLTGGVHRQRAHLSPVEEVAPDVVESAALWRPRQGVEARLERAEVVQDRVHEAIGHQEGDLRRSRLGPDVDGDSVVEVVVDEVDLVVRIAGGRQPAVDRPPDQHAIVLERHPMLPLSHPRVGAMLLRAGRGVKARRARPSRSLAGCRR
jgi:hypothetical protein